MEFRFYLYSDSFDEETTYYLNKMLSPKSFQKYTECFFMYVSDDYNEFLEKIRSFESDMVSNIAVYYDEILIDERLMDPVYDFLSKRKTGLFFLKDVISDAVLSNDKKTLGMFKEAFREVLSEDIIETGLVFIKKGNSLKAASELYIHRNTLNYRIDLIREKTSLDLKDFINQLAFYGLFHK